MLSLRALYCGTVICLLLAIRPSETALSRDFLNIPNPEVSPEKCNINSPYYLCDPEDILTVSTRSKLINILANYPRGMPCFCRRGCSVLGHSRKKLNVGVLIISGIKGVRNITSPVFREKLFRAFANGVRIHWDMSDCNGNDALILVINRPKPIVFVSYGMAVLRRLDYRCQINTERQFYGGKSIYSGVARVMSRLKNNVKRRCNCGFCPFTHNWHRLMAWVFAAIFLLSCLSVFARRIWYRRTNSPLFLSWGDNPRGRRSLNTAHLPPLHHSRRTSSPSSGSADVGRVFNLRLRSPMTVAAASLSVRDLPPANRRTLDRDLGPPPDLASVRPPTYSSLAISSGDGYTAPSDPPPPPPPYPGVAKKQTTPPSQEDGGGDPSLPPPYTAHLPS